MSDQGSNIRHSQGLFLFVCKFSQLESPICCWSTYVYTENSDPDGTNTQNECGLTIKSRRIHKLFLHFCSSGNNGKCCCLEVTGVVMLKQLERLGEVKNHESNVVSTLTSRNSRDAKQSSRFTGWSLFQSAVVMLSLLTQTAKWDSFAQRQGSLCTTGWEIQWSERCPVSCHCSAMSRGPAEFFQAPDNLHHWFLLIEPMVVDFNISKD